VGWVGVVRMDLERDLWGLGLVRWGQNTGRLREGLGIGAGMGGIQGACAEGLYERLSPVEGGLYDL